MTEAEQEHHSALMPERRPRSWSEDLDTLARLHRGLLALDADDDGDTARAPLPAPALVTLPEEPQEQRDAAVLPRRKPERQHEVPGASAGSGDAPAVERAPRQARPPRAQSQKPPAPKAEEGKRGPGRPARPSRPGQRGGHGQPGQSGQQPDAAGAEAAGADPAIAAVRETFRYITQAGDKAVGFFYGQLFVRRPELRQLFPPAMDEQRDRLFRALGRIVESLSAPEDMAAYFSQLGRDHRKYRIEPEMYEVVGASLLATLREFAGDAFTPQAEDAWTQVYEAGSSLMIRAAEEEAASSPPWWTAEVIHVDRRSDSLAVLTIAPDQPLPFAAGQHLTVQTPRWPRVWRPYSIAGMPRDDGLLTLHVKAIPGGWVSNALVRYTPPGSQLILGPPLGTMTLDRAATRDLLCVAGGTGLSPIKAIIEQSVRESAVTRRRICLYYGARRRQDLYDMPDLWRLADAYGGLELIPVASDDPAFDGMQGNVGRVAARHMPGADCDAYVAGPPDMVRETIRVLARAGLERERIHFDDSLLARKPRAGAGKRARRPSR